MTGGWRSWPMRFAAVSALVLGTAAQAVSLQDCQQNQKGYGNAASHELDMPPELIASLVQIALDGAAQSTNQAALAERAAYQPVDDPQDRFPWTTHTYVLLEGCFARIRLAELRGSAPPSRIGDEPAAPAPPPHGICELERLVGGPDPLPQGANVRAGQAVRRPHQLLGQGHQCLQGHRRGRGLLQAAGWHGQLRAGIQSRAGRIPRLLGLSAHEHLQIPGLRALEDPQGVVLDDEGQRPFYRRLTAGDG